MAAAAKKLRGATPHGGGAVLRAQQQAEALRQARAAELKRLPDVRSMSEANERGLKPARIRPVMETGRGLDKPLPKTKAAQANRAAAIRESSNAKRVEGIGRSRKASLNAEFMYGPISEQLQEMSPSDRRRFVGLVERITRGSNQSIGVLFEHAGGQKLYSAAIERIVYKSHRSEGFDLLETLAEYAELAATEYAPSKIGRLTI